jgi:hypothetical protein
MSIDLSSRRWLSLFLVLPLFTACKTGLPSRDGAHWTVDSVPARMFKHFTGYRADLNGDFRNYQYQKKRDVNRTLRLHFLGNSPENPLEAGDASQTKRRPPHSLAPDPLYYFGAESVFMGLFTLGVSGGFVPLPVDSILGTICGGWGEFGRGFTRGASGNYENPPSASRFEVKNH